MGVRMIMRSQNRKFKFRIRNLMEAILSQNRNIRTNNKELARWHKVTSIGVVDDAAALEMESIVVIERKD